MSGRETSGGNRGPGVPAEATTRVRLLEASFELLVRDGYHATTMKAVADHAGLTTGAIYANFVNKQELMGATLLARWMEVHRGLLLDEPPVAGTTAQGALGSSVAEHFVDHLASAAGPEHQLLTEITGAVMREEASESPLLRGVEMLESALAAAVDQAKADGEIRTDLSTGAIVAVLVALHLGTITSKSFGRRQLSADDARTLVQALARGLAPDPD